MRTVVIPTEEALARLETEGKVHGGVAARAGALILDAESHDEANKILQGLPAWGIAKWELTPLQSFETRREHDRQALEDLETTLQQKESSALRVVLAPQKPNLEGSPA